MRILFLTQWFQPEPVFKGLPFAKALCNRGHHVEVLTGFPNYPGGKLYPGYRVRLWQREVMDGILVHRVPLYPSHDKSTVKRILNYMSFGLSSALIGPLLVKKPDVIYVCNLVTLSFAAWVIRLFHSCPVVFDILDLWPDSVSGSGMMKSSFLMNILSRFCKSVYSNASHLVAISPGIKKELIDRGIPESHISIIYNWCDEQNMRPVAYDESLASNYGLAHKFVVMFAGNMGVMQKLEAVLDAAEMVAMAEPRIKFVFIGGGGQREHLKMIAEKRGLNSVIFIDRQPPEAMSTILALADVLLVHLKDIPLFRITIPSKLQAYMAAGKPVLMGVRGDAADIVSTARAGIAVEPENPESIAEGIIRMYKMSVSEKSQLGLNGQAYYEKYMSMAVGVDHFEHIFDALTKDANHLSAEMKGADKEYPAVEF